MHANQILYDFMENIYILVSVGVFIQPILSLRKHWIWGLILPIINLICVAYWIRNPIRDGDMPTMTAFNSFIYMFFFALHLMIFVICRYILMKKKPE